MALTDKLGSRAMIRTVDAGTLAPKTTNGPIDQAKTDFLKITGNGATLATGYRTVDIAATNDDATVANVCLRLQPKGAGVTFLGAQAAPPTWAAWMEGSVMYDTTAHKLKVATDSAWVAVH